MTAFSDYYDEGLTSKELVKIVQDLDLGVDVSESKNTFSPTEELISFFDSLGFKSAIKKIKEIEFGSYQASVNDQEGEFGIIDLGQKLPQINIREIKSKKDFVDLKEMISKNEFMAMETEYNHPDIISRELLNVCFNFGETESFLINYKDSEKEMSELFRLIFESEKRESSLNTQKETVNFYQAVNLVVLI